MTRRSSVAAAVLAGLALMPIVGRSATSDEWDRFRGPNGSGVIEATGLPLTFGPETNVIWKTAVAPGYSSPIIRGNRVFLTAFEDERLFTVCLDRESGRILWRRAVDRPRVEALDPRNHPAAPSPAIDEAGNVYVFFGEFGLVSYDPEGVERWRLPLGPFNNVYGMGASPIVAQGLVMLACDQQRDSFLSPLTPGPATCAGVRRGRKPRAATPHRCSTRLRRERCRFWWLGPSS